MEDLENKQQGYYCVIPWKILTDKNICSTAKLLYGEISALVNKEGFCWASNKHFAKLFGIKSSTRISALIRELKNIGYIYIEVDKKIGNKRKIWLCIHPITKNNNRYYSKEEETITQKRKKDKHIDKHIDNNIIKNNNLTITGKEFNDLIALFEPVNPSFERIFPNKGQRLALERMIKKHGYEKIKIVLKELPKLAKEAYAPIVTTPYQLEQKLGQVIIFLGREKNKGGGIVDARNIK